MDEDEQFSLGQTLPPPDLNSIIFEGALKKKSPKALAIIPWQDRFVRLTKDALFYYKKKDSALTAYQGAIPLAYVAKIIVDPPGSKRKYRIDIHLQEQFNRQFSFVAKNDAEMIQWHAVLESTLTTCREAQEFKTTTNAAMPTPGTAPGKIWKNVKEKDKKGGDKSKDESQDTAQKKLSSQAQFENQQRQVLERYIQLSKPSYQLAVPPPRVNMFESLKVLANCLFGGYRVEVQEQSLDLGSIFILGDSHYPMTHKSYLMHCAHSNNQFYGQALASMELLNLCGAGFPLFPQQIHCGQTKDAVYSIYHPPLRSGTDSLFAWLPRIERFPEEVVAWIAAHIVLTLDFIHNFHKSHVDPTLPTGQQWLNHPAIQFPTLSPETIFFDAQGQVRICDLFLNPNPTLVTEIPEYSCPEVLCHDQPSTTSSDYWRMGVLLYELVTGLPPFRPNESEDFSALDQNGQVSEDALNSYRGEIKQQLLSYQNNPNMISFPSFVSPELKSFITSLLTCDPSQRLTDQEKIHSHPFFTTQAANIHATLTASYIEECGEEMAAAQPIPPIQLWDVFSLINSPKLPWIHKNIINELAKDPNTPPNLTFGPRPVPVQRLNVKIKRIRGLMASWQRLSMPKMSLQVTVEGDTQKGTQPIQVEKNSDIGNFNETMTFDLMHGDDLSISSEIMIELSTQVVTSGGPNQSNKTSQTKLVGLVTFPLYEVRNLTAANAWLMIYDHTGNPVGELEVDLVWEQEDIDLSPQTLGELTDGSRMFQDLFVKPSAVPPRKLWGGIVDISTLAQFESSGATGDDVNEKKTNATNLNTQNITLNASQNMNTIRGTFIGSPTGRETLGGIPNHHSGGGRDFQQIYQPPNSTSLPPGASTPMSMPAKSMLGSSTANFGPSGSPLLVPMSPLPSSQSQQRAGNGVGSFSQLSPTPTPTGSHPQFFYSPPQPFNYDQNNNIAPPIPPPVPGGDLNSSSISSDPHSQPMSLGGFNRPASMSVASQTGAFGQPPQLSLTHSYTSAGSPRGIDAINMPSGYKPLGGGGAPPEIPPVPPIPPAIPDLPPPIPALPKIPQVPVVAPELEPIPQSLPIVGLGVSSAPSAVEPVSVPAIPATPPQVPVVNTDPNTVPKNWRTAKAPDGTVYYYNKVTKTTSWDPPECLLYVE